MAFKSRAVSVANTATRLDTTAETDGRPGSSLAFYNNDAAKTIYLGGSDVTTANGVPVGPLSWSPGVDLDVKEGAYGIVSSGTAEARVLEVGV